MFSELGVPKKRSFARVDLGEDGDYPGQPEHEAAVEYSRLLGQASRTSLSDVELSANRSASIPNC